MALVPDFNEWDPFWQIALLLSGVLLFVAGITLLLNKIM